MGSKGSKGWVPKRFLVLTAVSVLVSLQVLPAQNESRVPVLAELFTSEGCDSCPPADQVLAMLLEQQPVDGAYVVALSEHVTYWDHQGWKDPFAAQQFTVRQQQYGLRFNLDSIYTPQLVIDGREEYVGSDRRAIERAIRNSTKPKPELKITASESALMVTLSVSGPGLNAESGAELWFAVSEDHLVVEVKRGENANKTLQHSGVVRVLRSAGDASKAGPMEIKIDPGWKRKDLHAVAFVQSRKDRRVLAIGYTSI
jgi:hypothetical protein